MAATLLGEIWEGRRTDHKSDFVREHTRVFRVQTSLPSDNAQTVLAAVGLPVQGDVCPFDASARCTEAKASSGADWYEWTVTVTYSTAFDLGYDDPTTRPTIFNYSTEWVEKAVAKDLDNEIVQTSSYEIFDPAPTVRVPVRVVKASCYRATWSEEDDADPYIDTVNSTTVTIGGRTAKPGTLLLDDIMATHEDIGGVTYYRAEYTFKHRSDVYTDADVVNISDVTAGNNVVVLLSDVTDIVVGHELIFQLGGLYGETVYVEAVDTVNSTVTVDLVNDHPAGSTVTVRTYRPWQYVPYDAGYTEWDDSANQFVDILTTNGQPIAKPALLDGTGSQLDTSDPAAVPVLLPFRTRNTVDHNAITFP